MAVIDAEGPELTLKDQIDADEAARSFSDDDDDENVDEDDSEEENDDDDGSDDDDEEEGVRQKLRAFFLSGGHGGSDRTKTMRTTLYGTSSAHVPPMDVELGLLGHIVPDDDVYDLPSELIINVTDPFCLITVGVQGAGKSHTVNCILEACLLSCPPIAVVHRPMAVLVCHYDQSDLNCCEATGLGQPSRHIASLLAAQGVRSPAPSLPDSRLLVLCSPSFYLQRRQYYAGVCEVRPLLFKWGRLKAQQIKMLMKLDESSTQLYVSLMLDMLRGFQRQAKVPAFVDFVREFESVCSDSQSGPLRQRFQLLSSFVYEAPCNESLRELGVDLSDVMAAGQMVVVDLTDPMMSPADANGVFQVLLETFRCKQVGGAGKLVAFDEAHRYIGLRGESDSLAREITDCARLMRHEGLRLLISTQSPKAMPEELLELTTVLVAHRFQSGDWHDYLSKKVPLPEDAFATIRSLEPGEVLIYSARPCVENRPFASSPEVLRVRVRKRLTADRGASRVNRPAPRAANGIFSTD